MTFFDLAETAERYELYRPKVHHIIKEWLQCVGNKSVFPKAIDVACGTGDSTMPVFDLASRVTAIDCSEEMLARANNRGIKTFQMPFTEMPSLGRFDLITTCMAFHWFEKDLAIKVYKESSTKGAVWLVYNFFYGGHCESEELDTWYNEEYLSLYPSPSRGASIPILDKKEKDLVHLKGGEGFIPIEFTKDELVGYLTTQSNIENAVKNGKTYQQVEDDLHKRLRKLKFPTLFNYGYRYDIYQYLGG